MSKLNEGEIGKGRILGVALGPNHKGELQLEVEVSVDRRVIGDRENDPTEDLTPFTIFTSLHVDEQGDPESKRRNMTRDVVRRLTGVELKNEVSDDGYLRLTEESPSSVVPAIVGKEVMVKCNGKYYNLYFPKVLRPKTSYEELKKAVFKPY